MKNELIRNDENVYYTQLVMEKLLWLKPKLKLLSESLDDYDNLDEETKSAIDNIASILIKIDNIIAFKQ